MFEALIINYGYLALFIGTLLEGETFLIIAGFAAYAGYLQMPYVYLVAFIGSIIGDQFFYYLGRNKGRQFLERNERWKKKSEKVYRIIHRHQNLLALFSRFMYGIRTITPIAFGATGALSPLRFLILNIFGAALWSLLFGSLGYLFGSTLEYLLINIKHYQHVVFFSLLGIWALVWLGSFLYRRLRNRQA